MTLLYLCVFVYPILLHQEFAKTFSYNIGQKIKNKMYAKFDWNIIQNETYLTEMQIMRFYTFYLSRLPKFHSLVEVELTYNKWYIVKVHNFITLTRVLNTNTHTHRHTTGNIMNTSIISVVSLCLFLIFPPSHHSYLFL